MDRLDKPLGDLIKDSKASSKAKAVKGKTVASKKKPVKASGSKKAVKVGKAKPALQRKKIVMPTAQHILDRVSFLKHFYNLFNVDEIKHIIFSIGSIDVRTLFYQLLVAKSVDNEKSIFLEFEKAFSHFKENVIDKVKSDKKISIMKVYNSSKIGDSPKNIRDINKIKKKDAFATFGSLKKRQQWTNKINNIIRSKCKIYQFNFIDIDLGLEDDAIKKYSLDGIHINDIKIINKISELIHTK